MNKLVETTGISRVIVDEFGAEFRIPVKWVKISLPRTATPAQLENLRQVRLRKTGGGQV